MKFKLCVAAALLLCCIAPQSARAQAAPSFLATLTLTPPALTGHAGDTLFFTGILTNISDEEVFLNGDTQNGLPPSETLDDSPFFNNVPLSLAPAGQPGDTYTGSLFDVILASDAPVEAPLATFTIIGGADGGAMDTVASADFTAAVLPAAAPEPSALAAIGVMALCLGAIAARRVARRKPAA